MQEYGKTCEKRELLLLLLRSEYMLVQASGPRGERSFRIIHWSLEPDHR